MPKSLAFSFFILFFLISCKQTNSENNNVNPAPTSDISIINLSPNSSRAQKEITFSWGCNVENCSYRYLFNQNTSHTFTTESYQESTNAKFSCGNGTYYFHIQAKDELGNNSTTSSISFELFKNATADFINFCFIQSKVAKLEMQYPNILDTTTIGYSIENREITAFKISDNVDQSEDEARIIFIGTYHAREWIVPNVTYLIIQELLENYEQDASTRSFINNTEIFVVPMVNPDGHIYSMIDASKRFWRKNRRNNKDGTFGVDLNRNHSFKWGLNNTGSSPLSSSQTYRGVTADSEPETRAVRDFVRKYRPDILLSYHSYGELVLYPWGYTRETTGSNHSRIAAKISEKIREVHGRSYTFQQGIELYPTNGDLTDWSYGELGILSFTIELRPRSNSLQGFVLPENEILPTFQENYNSVLYLLEEVQNIQ